MLSLSLIFIRLKYGNLESHLGVDPRIIEAPRLMDYGMMDVQTRTNSATYEDLEYEELELRILLRNRVGGSTVTEFFMSSKFKKTNIR